MSTPDPFAAFESERTVIKPKPRTSPMQSYFVINSRKPACR